MEKYCPVFNIGVKFLENIMKKKKIEPGQLLILMCYDVST